MCSEERVSGNKARGKPRQPLAKQFIKKRAIQIQLKIFNYYKELNLISEPPRGCCAARRLWDVKWIFVSNYDKGWRGFHRARAPALMDFVAHLFV